MKAFLLIALSVVLTAAPISLASATGAHHAVVRPTPAPTTPAAPMQYAAGTSATASWWVFGFVGASFGYAIYMHAECVREKRGCYEHAPER